MKTGRRGFLGMFAGGVVAGPGVAKAAIAQMPQGMGLVAAGFDSIDMGRDAMDPAPPRAGKGSWRDDRIAYLRRRVTGELTDDEREERDAQRLRNRKQMISQHVAGLVSVSPSQKVAMYIRRIEEHHEELERREHKWSLTRMLRGD